MRTRWRPCWTAWLAAAIVLAAGAVQADALSPAQLFDRAAPAVVFLYTDLGGGRAEAGTGCIVRADGLVVTNAHVVARGKQPAGAIAVFLKPSRLTGDLGRDLARRYRGRLVLLDPDLDLALVRIEAPPDDLAVLPVASSAGVQVGDAVFAIGHPEQGGLWSLTRGIISARRADFGGVAGKDVFQTDAGINRGHSGGPLLDAGGRLVGINTAIARKAADGLAITDINYALQSDVVLSWLARHQVALDGVAVLDRAQAAAGRPEKHRPPDSRLPADHARRQRNDASPRPAAEPPAQPSKPPATTTPPSPNGRQEQWLTPLRPYRMEDLHRRMQEMESFMEQMRRQMDAFKSQRQRRSR